MLSLSVPPLTAQFIIGTLPTWNGFLLPLVLTSSQASRKVPLGLLRYGVGDCNHTR
jgi:ABC-type glycerol-3-phosphate transport system permease component